MALADDVVPAETANRSPGQAYEVLASPPPMGSQGALEQILMGFLAAAAVGFQLRRKYKASERAWHRILTSRESVSTELRPLPPRRSLTSSAIRWQQTP
jgi:hypothetical protein